MHGFPTSAKSETLLDTWDALVCPLCTLELAGGEQAKARIPKQSNLIS